MIQSANPLMWVIDTAPLFLGITAWLAGRKQDELKLLIENQENVITAQTAKLRQALSVAQTADKIKSRFLANMSHELRTPLNAIIGFSQIIQENFEYDDFRNQNEFENLMDDANRIESAGKHLLNLVNTILDFSKAEAGELTLHPIEFDIHEIVEEA
ncbi:MAG: histidine kinase dimerization/phospho-acceptor domain-containing protein, partial [Chloroflexota bacterium]